MPEMEGRVSFRYDAPEIAPRTYAEHLMKLANRPGVEVDSYTLGGIVAEFERQFAKLIGKEMAVFMPTGTLANHLAVRALAKDRRRVLVQERGHLYNDSGDCLQSLSGFNVIPLGHDQATFGLEDVQAAVEAAASSRVRVGVGAIVIETPVRRKHGEMFDHDEMKRICSYARRENIGLHLDGARLFIASAYTGIPPAEYAVDFDTVYISLYKYFGTPCGAVLAGDASLLENIHHERRMFGGALNQAWMFAAATMEHMDEFDKQFAHAVSVSEELKRQLGAIPGIHISEIRNGTNVFRMQLDLNVGAEKFREHLERLGIWLPEPENGIFYLKVNESILSIPLDSLIQRFKESAQV